MSRRWISERKRDPYHLKAKQEGYRSRAAYKLIQLNNRFHFLFGARYVLDLGAAPGGWLQVASEAIGEKGMIVGVDLNEIKIDLENVETIVGDINEVKIFEKIIDKFPVPIDVVLSDLSPNISGTWDLDQFRQIALARRAMDISRKILKSEGWLILKVFQGPEHESFLEELKKNFSKVKIIKPKASRKKSAEVYAVARKPSRR